MMKIVVAPQAFKGTASARVVAEAMRRGVLAAMPSAEVVLVPMADGGTGMVEALVVATGGRFVESPAHDAVNRPITARWGILGDGETAVIEVAAASGLALLRVDERDATRATSFGTGELVSAALDAGYQRLLIGLGDSATNDGGSGLASALGIRAVGPGVERLPPGGAALSDLAYFDLTERHPFLASATIVALCDVDNPLCWPSGASVVYGPQKGASAADVERLDAALERFASVVERQFGRPVRDLPGAGAAGGMGAGLVALCSAELRPGFSVVSEHLELPAKISGAALVLTGEGRVDQQTLHGKGVGQVAKLARNSRVPCVVIAGAVEIDAEAAAEAGIHAAFSIASTEGSVDDLALTTPRLIEQTTEDAVRRMMADRA